eukprot:8725524-Alexandrium_andersonii.AAC.1
MRVGKRAPASAEGSAALWGPPCQAGSCQPGQWRSVHRCPWCPSAPAPGMDGHRGGASRHEQ